MVLRIRVCSLAGLGVVFALALTAPVQAAETFGQPLVKALQGGGYVLVMRHASSPMANPDKATAEPDNTKLERQLDQVGKNTSRAMGIALKSLRIPMGTIYSSPTYRAQQTIRLAGLPKPELRDEIGDNGSSMAPQTVASWAAWLKMQTATKPRAGTNTLLVTHLPNVAAAFPDEAKGLADGEAIVFKPDGAQGEVVAHVKIENWPQLAAAH